MVLLSGCSRPVVAHTHSPPPRRNAYETLSPVVCGSAAVCECINLHDQPQQHGGHGTGKRRRRIFCSKLHSRPSCRGLYPPPDVHRHLDFTDGPHPTMQRAVAWRPAGMDRDSKRTWTQSSSLFLRRLPKSFGTWKLVLNILIWAVD